MRPVLDTLELPRVQEIGTRERRALAEHRAPGMDGSYLQNLGRAPARVTLWGVAAGPDALAFIEELDGLFRAGEPVPFTADIVADAEIQEVLIEDLDVEELAGKPDRFSYLLTLQEHIEPAEADDASLLDADILEEAGELVDDLVEGLDLGLDLPTGLERFVSPLTDLLGRLQQLRSDLEGSGGSP
jgi:hypothetical protein